MPVITVTTMTVTTMTWAYAGACKFAVFAFTNLTAAAVISRRAAPGALAAELPGSWLAMALSIRIFVLRNA
jgi:hypothetical protein